MTTTTRHIEGSLRRFGAAGVVYEVVRELSPQTALIRVLETGEETSYPIADILKDPTA
jgi:Family of unknown function (DUF5397)